MSGNINILSMEEIEKGFAMLGLKTGNALANPLPTSLPDSAMENGWFKKFSLIESGHITSAPNACNGEK